MPIGRYRSRVIDRGRRIRRRRTAGLKRETFKNYINSSRVGEGDYHPEEGTGVIFLKWYFFSRFFFHAITIKSRRDNVSRRWPRRFCSRASRVSPGRLCTRSESSRGARTNRRVSENANGTLMENIIPIFQARPSPSSPWVFATESSV